MYCFLQSGHLAVPVKQYFARQTKLLIQTSNIKKVKRGVIPHHLGGPETIQGQPDNSCKSCNGRCNFSIW